MTDEELKELRDKLDLCYQPGGKLVWSEVKKVLEDAYQMGRDQGNTEGYDNGFRDAY